MPKIQINYSPFCEDKKCPNFIKWGYNSGDCFSCHLIGQSHYIDRYPNNCLFIEEISGLNEKSLRLHSHDDIDCLFANTNIPIADKQYTEVYLMQQSRIVFIGTRKAAVNFFINHNGGYLKSIYPDIVIK